MVDSGIILLKYWLEVSPEEQTRRLESRIDDPRKIWKLSDMDLKSYARWDDYSRARDEMFAATDTAWAPWFVAHSDDKKRARLNVISHLLSQIPYEAPHRKKVKLPEPQGPRRDAGRHAPPLHPHAVLRRPRIRSPRGSVPSCTVSRLRAAFLGSSSPPSSSAACGGGDGADRAAGQGGRRPTAAPHHHDTVPPTTTTRSRLHLVHRHGEAHGHEHRRVHLARPARAGPAVPQPLALRPGQRPPPACPRCSW